MLHPFMPFVTEEIYLKLPHVYESSMISEYPQFKKEYSFNKDVNTINRVIEIITKIRNVKNDKNITSNILIINKLDLKNRDLIDNNEIIFKKIIKAEIVKELKRDMTKIELIFSFGEIIIGYDGKETKLDFNQLKEDQQAILKSIKRRQKLLDNDNYRKRAPEKIVLEEEQKLKEEQILLNNINQKIKTFK